MADPRLAGVAGITFDFFGTLATLRNPRGRSGLFREYLHREGLSGHWQRAWIYPLFARLAAHWDEAGRPGLWIEFTRALFEMAQVDGDPTIERHVTAVREIFGPEAFVVYDDVMDVLEQLRDAGTPVAVVSNWPHGLRHYLDALGLGDRVQTVLCSAELGARKPDARIFQAACEQLGLPPSRVLHVGDDPEADMQGGGSRRPAIGADHPSRLGASTGHCAARRAVWAWGMRH